MSNREIAKKLGIGKSAVAKWLKSPYPQAESKSVRIGRSHLIIPDCQVRPGVNVDHLRHIGNYIASKKPEVVVCIGDFADMPSLSSYSIGKAEAEGQRYDNDIKAVKHAMGLLLTPVREVKGYSPRLVMVLGNHENRIIREVEANPRLIGKISIDDLGYKDAGWEVHDFLEVVKIDGFEYSHYFTSGVLGRPVSSAAALLRERHSSAVQGHLQICDVAFHKKSGHIAIISGCCYTHEEKYLTPQMAGKSQRRQIIVLHEVRDGIADPMFVSLDFLKHNYA